MTIKESQESRRETLKNPYIEESLDNDKTHPVDLAIATGYNGA